MGAIPKILILDIETSNFKADLSPILCFGYKWLGHKTVYCPSVWDYPLDNVPFMEWDKPLCKKISELVNAADCFVAHYGDKFDLPFVNSRLTINGVPKIPRGVSTVDTWKLARYQLQLKSNKLSNVAKFLQCGEQKDDSMEWSDWMECVRGSKHHIRKMISYCKQDVRTLEAVFDRLRPFAYTLPNQNLWKAGQHCHACGSINLQSWGYRNTKTQRYRRMRCSDCGSMSQLNARETQIKGI